MATTSIDVRAADTGGRTASRSLVRDGLLLLLLAIVFFYRGQVLPGLSVSPLAAVLGLALTLALLVPTALATGVTYAPPLAYAAFFLLGLVSIGVNGVLFPEQGAYSALFAVEWVLNLLLLYLGYVLVRYYRYDLDRILRFIIGASLIIIVAILSLATQLSTVRRIGALDADLPVAVNHAGHALVIVVLSCYYQLVRMRGDRRAGAGRRLVYAVMLAVASAGALLTGSKAALVSLGIAALLVLAVSLWRGTRDGFYVLAAVMVFVLALATLGEGKFGGLISRFQPDRFQFSMFARLDVMLYATSDIRLSDLLFGLPWRYQPINPGQGILYPHNIALSVLLHLGILPFLTFLYILASRVGRLVWQVFTNPDWTRPFVLTTVVLTTIIYSFTSGRLTRIMTIFFVLGMAEAYLRQWRISQY